MNTVKFTCVCIVVTMQTIWGHYISNYVEQSSLWINEERSNLAEDTNPDLSSHCASDVRCRCEDSPSIGLVADCSNLNISVIPEFHSNVTTILLQRNSIKHVRIEDGQVPRSILYLDISENRLESFIDDPFRAMYSLLHLDLSHNSLKYNPSVFPHNVFSGLKRLHYLNLKSNNKFDRSQSTNLSYPVSIGNIVTLKTCLLDGVDQAGFTGDFKSLVHLESLDLGGDEGNCTLPILRSGYFENVTSVRNLSLSNCQIRFIENGTFRVLTKLYLLNVSNNDRLTFNVMSNLTGDLQAVPIHILDLSRIHCDYGPGTALYMEDVSSLRNHTNLTDLYIDSNRLSLTQYGVISALPKSLRFVSAKANRLTFGKYVFELSSAINLEVFDGSNQYPSHDPNTGLRDCNDWRAPPSNPTDWRAPPSNPNDWWAPPSKPDWRAQPYTIESPIMNIYLPPNLKNLIFHKSVLDYQIGIVPLAPNNLTRVDLHSNLLHAWKGTILNINKVEYIDGSNNYCTYISDQFFDHCPNLKELILHDNLLGNALNNDTDGKIFRRLLHLKVLDLSWNRIQAVPRSLLKNQNELQILNISNNELVTFDLRFEHMTNLQYLNLSYNRLSILSQDNRKQIDALKSRNVTVNLYGNKLQCSCETMDFLTWLGNRRETFDNFQNYECRFGDDTTKSLSDLENILIKLKKSCNKYTGVIAATTVAVLLAIILILLGISYRYRWKLRYLYYMTKVRYRGYTSLASNANSRGEYPYDAFISYSEDDGLFVTTELLDNLEKKYGLSLCLHQRDFVPGQYIAQNIINALHQSRKTVVLTSKKYIKSYWCEYEFNMARMENIYAREGKFVILLVLYENVDLPMNMMDLIDSQSYIEYPRDEQGNVVFWRKLAETISL